METNTLEKRTGASAVQQKSYARIDAPARAEQKPAYRENTWNGAALDKLWTSAYSAD